MLRFFHKFYYRCVDGSGGGQAEEIWLCNCMSLTNHWRDANSPTDAIKLAGEGDGEKVTGVFMVGEGWYQVDLQKNEACL